jgi:hypothetical protein
MSSRSDPSGLTCPSAPPEPGSVLLGIVAAKGEIAYVTPNIPTTQTLLDSFASNGIAPENRLRFAGPCMGRKCVQWAGARCGLIDRVVAHFDEADVTRPLPKCGIRSTCRWFAQHGRTACASCPEVIRKPAGP